MTARPNILLVVLDSARADRFSCYGYGKPTTPNIDRIAEEGTVFERCYAESTWTLPSCYSLMTGLATQEHQSEVYREIPGDLPTIGDALADTPYATGMVSANLFLGPKTGLNRSFDHFRMPLYEHPVAKPILKYLGIRLGLADKGGAQLNRLAMKFLQNADTPWFCLLWNQGCHPPFFTRREHMRRLTDTPLSFSERWEMMGKMRALSQLVATGTERDVERLNVFYDSALAYTDSTIGNLRDRLIAQGKWEDTAVIISADHGEMLGEHGLAGHGRPSGMYRQLIRVPMIVRWPGAVAAGERSEALVQLGDIAETIARAAGAPASLHPSAADRVDLREAAAGDGRDFAICQRLEWPQDRFERAREANPDVNLSKAKGEIISCIRGDWQYIDAGTGDTELYNVVRDPEETTSLLDARPAVADEMRQIIDRWREKAVPHSSTRGRTESEDPALRRRLEGMGYY